MTLATIARQAEKLVADHSPHILTAVGVAGTITTAVLTGKAAFKASSMLAEDSPHLTTKEVVQKTWKLYIPPVAVGALTVSSIILANQIGTRRAAAMAAAYATSERLAKEYREKVIEKFGETKDQAVRDEVMQDRMNNEPVSKREVIITGGGNVLCYEALTGRYFLSDMESMKKAVNDLNYKVINHYYASLSEFYDLLGLDHTDISDELGWNSDKLLEPSFGTHIADDGRPALSISFDSTPIRGYSRIS